MTLPYSNYYDSTININLNLSVEKAPCWRLRHRLSQEVLHMRIYFITVRSVTYGQRAESVLRKGSIPCSLQRTPKWMEEQGCGYCLRLRTEDITPAVRLLRSAQVPFRRVYVQQADGEVVEVRL